MKRKKPVRKPSRDGRVGYLIYDKTISVKKLKEIRAKKRRKETLMYWIGVIIGSCGLIFLYTGLYERFDLFYAICGSVLAVLGLVMVYKFGWVKRS